MMLSDILSRQLNKIDGTVTREYNLHDQNWVCKKKIFREIIFAVFANFWPKVFLQEKLIPTKNISAN